jgi:ParB-like chromosome segregation protein Spo0J
MVNIEYRHIDKLHKLPNNPRFIKDSQFKILCKSLQDNKDYFEARPIILSNRTGQLVIIAGNQRYEAAKEIGMTEVPTVLLPDLTEEREKELIIRDNVQNGDWNMEMLANEWNVEDLNNWGAPVPNFIVEDEIEAKGRMAATLDEKLDTYMNASIKQIVLYYDLEEYEKMLRSLDEIAKEHGFEDNSSTIKHLVDSYLAK